MPCLHRARIAMLAFALLALACASAQTLRDAETSFHEHTVGLPQHRTFDAVVAVVVAEGFDVAVAERDAGLLRIQPESLSPAALDRYCDVPLVYEDSGQPVTTFTAYDETLREDGERLVGSVALSFVVSATSTGEARIRIRSDFEVKGPRRKAACQSKGTLEAELFGKIDRQLVAPRR